MYNPIHPSWTSTTITCRLHKRHQDCRFVSCSYLYSYCGFYILFSRPNHINHLVSHSVLVILCTTIMVKRQIHPSTNKDGKKSRHDAATKKKKQKPIPVTILSGFLGKCVVGREGFMNKKQVNAVLTLHVLYYYTTYIGCFLCQDLVRLHSYGIS